MNSASMQWYGKAIGGILGFVAAGPLGSLLGVAIGHRYDLDMRGRVRGSAPHEVSRLFFEVAFEAMGAIAKVDGRVSENEIRVARRIMDALRLSPEQVREAIEHFTRGKAAGYPLEARLAELRRELHGRDELARAFVQLELQAAIGAGAIAPEKRQLLWRVASGLGVDRAELAQLEALVRAFERGRQREPSRTNVADAYRVLGVAPNASDRDVKAAYRRLMNRHHPDKLVARGLPESMASVAEQKTQEIRAAYEAIKAARGLR
jgi:DnaJ like chaperone protein